MRGISRYIVFISEHRYARKSFISRIITNNRYNLYFTINSLQTVTIYKKI